MAANEDGIFGLYPTATWDVKGRTISFPVLRIEETHVNRVVEHERMYRKGARLDNTGSKAKAWRITVEAFNSDWQEEGVVKDNFYPDELNKLLDTFDEQETGDLTLPTRGPRRCKAREYNRVEEASERDMAVVVLLFVEDNEDDASAVAWTAPSAHSVIVKKAQDAERAAGDQAPMQKDLWISIREAAAAIESYANAPFEFVGDMQAHVDMINNSVAHIEDTYSKRIEEANNEVETMLSDPCASLAGRLLRDLADTASRALGDKLAQGPVIYTKTWPTDTTLFGIAATEGIDLQRLLELNSALDPFLVPASTPVSLEK